MSEFLLGERLGVLTVYVILLSLNYYAFRKLRRLNPQKWQHHEGNLLVRSLIRKLGLTPTYIIMTEIGVLVFLVFPFPWTSFLTGLVCGVLFFTVIHDFHTFRALVKKEEVK